MSPLLTRWTRLIYVIPTVVVALTIIAIVLFLTSCASALGAGCVTLQTASLKVTDAAGKVKFEQAPDTVAYCPPSVSASGVGR